MRRTGFAVLLFFLAVCLLALVPDRASAALRRVALLIGNSDYRYTARLNNPLNDVGLLKDALNKAGFDVIDIADDETRAGMVSALRAFEDKAVDSDIALVYFSGHGLELEGQNYLIPVDARLATDRDVEDEAISLDRVQRAVAGARRLRLVILDSCRNNPFETSMNRTKATRAVMRGLARVEPASADTLIAFAAKAGTVAQDGDGANSPFAASLARQLVEPGLDVRIAFGRVRDEVMRKTSGEQEPFVYGSLGGAEIFLSKLEPPPGPGDVELEQREHAAFEAARSVGTAGAFDAFISAFPNSYYAQLARELRSAALSPSGAAPAPAALASEPKPAMQEAAIEPPAQIRPSAPATVAPEVAKPPAKKPTKKPAAAKSTPPKRTVVKKPLGASNCFTFNNERICQ